ncbi:cold-shock protein [Rhizobium sp. Rhizsp82]|uniref:cold-shock protein n=1 Tax=Rhizobium sp. Rhizsp82 TaxID=3243057 RepID=UPI0039B6697C
MPTGRLKFFDAGKGYGFIVPDAGGPDIYLSARAVEQSKLPTLKSGDRLHFELRVTGPKRTAVSLTKAASLEEVVADFEEEWGLKPSE